MGIAENIKHLRQLHDLSQKDFGLIAGVSDKAVSAWENGLKEPRMGAIQKIADHFGLQKSNIIENNGLDLNAIAPIAEPYPSAPSEPEYTDEEKGIITGYRKAPAPLKEIVRFTLKDYMKDEAPAASPKEQPKKEESKKEAPKKGKWGQLLADFICTTDSGVTFFVESKVENIFSNPQFEKIVEATYKQLKECMGYKPFVDGLKEMVLDNRDDLSQILDKPQDDAVRFMVKHLSSKMK